MTSASLPQPRPPCAAAIVFAMDVEADALAKRARETVEFQTAGPAVREGLIAGRRVAWCVGGAGARAAEGAARLLVDGHRPAVILSAGFAGGLDPRLARGRVVRPERAVNDSGGPGLELSMGRTAPAGLTIVSVDRVVTTAAEKRDLAKDSGAAVVDMETYAVAAASRDAGLPCACIRVISDDFAQELPRELATLVQPQSGMRRLGAALGAVGRRPRAALDMWQLWERAVLDARTLAAAIEAWLVTLDDGRG